MFYAVGSDQATLLTAKQHNSALLIRILSGEALVNHMHLPNKVANKLQHN